MRTHLLIPVLAAALAGCTQSLDASLDAPMSKNLGQAVASMDSQIIPAPVSTLAPDETGARAALAIGRYEKGEVYPPLTPATSEKVGASVGKGMAGESSGSSYGGK